MRRFSHFFIICRFKTVGDIVSQIVREEKRFLLNEPDIGAEDI